MAHVGSPNVFFEGSAGPYAVRVVVRPPQVVPGQAEVVVRTTALEVQGVLVRPVVWRTGVAGAPAGDAARPVVGEPGTYSGTLWLMSRGAYSVYVTVRGARGSGTVIVPVMSVATARLGFTRPLAITLTLFGALLFAGLVTIVYAASGEALARPDADPGRAGRRRARVIATASVPVIAILVFGGARWWEAVDRDYQATIYRPLAGITTLQSVGARIVLTFAVRDTTGGGAAVPVDPILPDHGKLMHLFLIRDSAPEAFAHLHPVEGRPMTFSTSLPPLPAGRYRLFADLVFETGAEQTVTGLVDLSTIPLQGAASDPDDAWSIDDRAAPIAEQAADTLGDGSVMVWSGPAGPIAAGRDIDLRFDVRDRTGAPASIEPYMGMAAHAALVRDDGSVFVHLHPMGTASAAAQQAFVLRDRGDTTPRGRLAMRDSEASRADRAGMAMPMSGSLSFPYAFPKPGRYLLWIQVKRGGRILTAPFSVVVQ